MTDLAILSHEVLYLSPAASVEVVLSTMDKIDCAVTQAKELKRVLEELVCEWIRVNGDLVCGDTRWYVGKEKTTRCLDTPQTVHELFKAVGGDFEAFCGHLASGAIKHGAAKGTLAPEVFARLFETVEKPDLKTGKPAKKLIRLDERFAR